MLERPHPDWTIARANSIFYTQKHNRAANAELADVEALSISWRDSARKRAEAPPRAKDDA
jgi:MOSC domain-containing protein YiiM